MTPAIDAWLRETGDRLEMDGASLTIRTTSHHHGVLAATGDTARRLATLTMLVSEGPVHDAFVTGDVTTIGDLTDANARARWPVFSVEAMDLDVHAVLAAPIRVGSVTLGMLTSFALGSRRFEHAHVAQARDATADAATLLVSAWAPDGGVALPLAVDLRDVHVATGMLAVQLGIDVDAALVVLCSQAYVEGLEPCAVATAIIGGRSLLPFPQG